MTEQLREYIFSTDGHIETHRCNLCDYELNYNYGLASPETIAEDKREHNATCELVVRNEKNEC